MKYTILLLLKATPKWWGMSKEYRADMYQRFVFPLLASHAGHMRVQVFNSGAFHAKISDFLSIETENLEKYYQFLHQLKAAPLFSGGFFELEDVVMGAENGFRDFNEQQKREQKMIMN
jgi:hypothetical protein